MEGEFERSTDTVSNGCETSMKKFNFNFKFLDRFKKSQPSEDLEYQEDQADSNDETFAFQEMPRSSHQESTQTKAQFTEEESFSDHNPEDFAEKL